jgi:hypothetical protein
MKRANLSFSILSIACFALTSLGCMKTDSLGLAGNADGSAGKGGAAGGATALPVGGNEVTGGATAQPGGGYSSIETGGAETGGAQMAGAPELVGGNELIGGAIATGGTGGTFSLLDMLPADNEVGTWVQTGGVELITDLTGLYFLIDGGAPKYIDRGWVRSVYVNYSQGSRTIQVAIHDMGTAANAQSIYNYSLPAARLAIPGLANAVVDMGLSGAYAAYAYVDRFYIELNITEKDAAALTSIESFMSDILSRIRRSRPDAGPDAGGAGAGGAGGNGGLPDSGVSTHDDGTCPLLLPSVLAHYPSEADSPCPSVEPPSILSCPDSLAGVTCVYPSSLSPGVQDIWTCDKGLYANPWLEYQRTCKRTGGDCLVDADYPGGLSGARIQLTSSCASRPVVNCLLIANDTAQTALDSMMRTIASNCLESTGATTGGALSVFFDGDCPTSFIVDPTELADCVGAQLESERLDCASGLVCGASDYVSLGCGDCR